VSTRPIAVLYSEIRRRSRLPGARRQLPSTLAQREVGLYIGDTLLILMPYFHATAVFEIRGSSLEEADRTVAAVFKSIRHPRVRYYEHDTSGGTRTSQKSDSLYFTVIADFDVEAGNDESAADIVEEVLDSFSTDTIHYFTHGIIAGEQRVRPEQRVQHAPAYTPEREAHAEQGDPGERGGRKRGSRGRGRRRGGTQEAEGMREEEPETIPPALPQEEPVESLVHAATVPTDTSSEESAALDVHPQERELPPPAPETFEVTPAFSPPRSSAAMRVTLIVTLHASELALPANGSALPEQEELISLATAEARRQHPELPTEVTPECEVVSLPWGDTLLTLTWHYDVPVLSSVDAA
jgi:hypothetical protein